METLIIILLAIAIAVLFFFIGRVKSKHLFEIEPLKNKVIVFATPHRLELILLALYLFFFFVADLAQNKLLDLGLSYNVIVFWNITAPALYVWQIFLILFHVALVGLFVLSLQSKDTNRFYDLIVGTVALFGVAILLAGVIVQIYSPMISFLWMNMRSIDFYHAGVYLEMFAALYWCLTK